MEEGTGRFSVRMMRANATRMLSAVGGKATRGVCGHEHEKRVSDPRRVLIIRRAAQHLAQLQNGSPGGWSFSAFHQESRVRFQSG